MKFYYALGKIPRTKSVFAHVGLNIFISEIDRHMYKVYKMLQIMGLERKQQLI